jgi:hypothetical protein
VVERIETRTFGPGYVVVPIDKNEPRLLFADQEICPLTPLECIAYGDASFIAYKKPA